MVCKVHSSAGLLACYDSLCFCGETWALILPVKVLCHSRSSSPSDTMDNLLPRTSGRSQHRASWPLC